MFPFKEEIISDNISIRTIPKEVSSDLLIWHMDKEDRIIYPIGDNDWKFQFDNELPINFNKKITIKKEVFHRLIKGKGDLKFLLFKVNI